jgi:hypothetical protein
MEATPTLLPMDGKPISKTAADKETENSFDDTGKAGLMP